MCSKDLIFQTFLIPSACRTVKSRLDLIAQCAVGENAGARVVDSWPRHCCACRNCCDGSSFTSDWPWWLRWCRHCQSLCRYLVGTEDGYIHRCLCTHTEQYLCSYKGHMVSWAALLPPLRSCVLFSFSALTLLIERQEGHPAQKKTGCWFVGGDDLTGALYVL